jgi:2-keto-4-pentenoate hydratase
MDADAVNAAAERVVAARIGRRRVERLPGVMTLTDGYAVQQRANDLLERQLGPRAGHKIGGTTEVMRRYINVPEPLAGEVFAGQVHADGATVRSSDFVRLGIETEIAVAIARDLPARAEPYGRDEISEAVGACMASIELVDDRYDDFRTIGGPTQIADNAFDAGVVLGPPRTAWQDLDLAALVGRTWRDGTLVAEGRGEALLGHPLDALAWIATKRAELGLGLTAGSFVTLGTITPVVWVDAPARFTIEIEALGSVGVTVG